MRYCKENKKEIAFPLGGIGSGCIGLSGNGSFTDIEIFNRPNKGSEAAFTHFAVKAEDEKNVVDVRVLHTDLLTGYAGHPEREKYTGYGFGPDRGSMAGFPHFSKGEFEGNFPFAELDFEHENFPGRIQMTAFNPLIPTNEDDSSLPAAFFEFLIFNTSNKELKYTIALSCNNYYAKNNAVNRYQREGGIHSVFLSNSGDKDSADYGDLTIATDTEEASFQEYWFRGSWFDNVSVFWNDFSAYGRLKNRDYSTQVKAREVFAENDIASLAASVSILPGEYKKVRFVLSWSMPIMKNTWQITQIGLTEEETAKRRNSSWKNYYAMLFQDSRDSAQYALKYFQSLYEDTRKYTDLIYRSSLPLVVLDAVTANISILKSTTCLRLTDGSFYGFEGTHAQEGSCEGTCTHVWSYAYAAAFLFPRLERSARRLEYTESMQPNGGMGFRLQLPLGLGATNHRPAIDGQYGTVMRVYREFMISGDKQWLEKLWPAVKETIAYAWSEQNPDRWDSDRDGIAEGCQHHTLDMELFGANSWLSGMYLGGLKAGAALAGILGDTQACQEYGNLFAAGSRKLNQELYNGEYFYQSIDLGNRELLSPYTGGKSEHSENPWECYWNEEKQQMKYQIGEGCSIDQVLGQWHADLLNLGDIFDREKVKSALQAVFQYNYVACMREHVNPCRIYSLDEESGTVICSYPPAAVKPHIPVPYAEETMHGFEYQAASHMIRNGLEREGLLCVKAVRDKYTGEKRNPWNEMECGSNYARSMASYALLLVYSGFRYDMHRKMIGFQPIHQKNARFFWSLDSGFGEVIFEDSKVKIGVAYGKLSIRFILLAADTMEKVKSVCFQQEELPYTIEQNEIKLGRELILDAGEEMEIKMQK